MITYTIDDFDDGHRPGNTTTSTRIARHANKNTISFGAVFDDCLPIAWCDRAYEYAILKGRPWGVYVLTKDALDESIDAEDIWNMASKANDDSDNSKYKEKALGLIATRSLIFCKGKDIIGKDINALHGTVIWCLSSDCNSSVEYHIDYAELYRYETNIIVPPIYAGTCHVSPISDGEMKGGDFTYNMGGLDHYQRFGYKSKLVSPEDKDKDRDSNDWVTIRYKFNRGILHDGDFPHASTKIERIPDGKRRVILGFNCFTEFVGECCIRAPEHSDVFNRTIKLYQAMARVNPKATGDTTIGSSNNKSELKGASKISVKEIMKNPALARMIVLAAKKVQAQQDLI